MLQRGISYRVISPPKRSSCSLRSELALEGCRGHSRIAVLGAAMEQHRDAWISLPHQPLPNIIQHKFLSRPFTFFCPPSRASSSSLWSEVADNSEQAWQAGEQASFQIVGAGNNFIFSGLGLKPTAIILPSSQIRQVTVTKPI